MDKRKLVDYAIVAVFCAALRFRFAKPTSLAQTIPWAVWRL